MSGRGRTVIALLAILAVLTAAIVEERAGAVTGQARMVFVNGGRLFTINADGGSRTQLTGPRHPASYSEIQDGDPSWSPDGTLIAFSRGEFSTSSRLMILNPTSGVITPLTAPRPEARDYEPQWSPDGQQLAFVRFTSTEARLSSSLMIINRDGTGEHAVLTESFKPVAPPFAAVLQPVWSPDGSRIAYSRSVLRRDGSHLISLYLIKPDGTERTLLAHDGSAAAFSPDGSQIAFASSRDRNGEVCGSDECNYESELYVMDADGTDRRRLTHNKGNDYDPDWSADGQRIAFSSNRTRPETFGGEEIYSIRPDGSCLTWLTNGAPDSEAPDWEPNPTSSTDPGSCGAVPREPLVETDLRPLTASRSFPVFWLGKQYRGLLLDYVDGDRDTADAIYDDCARFQPDQCPPMVDLQEASVCIRKRYIVAEAGLAERYLVRRGALLADFGYDGGMAAYTGGTYIKIYAGQETTPPPTSHTRAAELQVIRALDFVGRAGPKLLPRVALPNRLLVSLRRVRATYERLGSAGETARELKMRVGAVVKKLRLERALDRYGPVQAVRCEARGGRVRLGHRARRRQYPHDVDAIRLLAESKIRAAMARGEFDNLPGRGRPLPLEDLSRVPAELRMGFKMLRNAGCLPPELEARNEMARLGPLIATAGDETERARLARLRSDAECRYRLLVERRLRSR